jgi:hypothetical protein
MTVEYSFPQERVSHREIFRKAYLIYPANPQNISGEELPDEMSEDTLIVLSTENSGCDGLRVYSNGEERSKYSQQRRGPARDVTQKLPDRNILSVSVGEFNVQTDFKHNLYIQGDVIAYLTISKTNDIDLVYSVL